MPPHPSLQVGVYAVTLLVGDPSASTSVSWLLGEVELVLEAGEDAGPGLPPRTAASQPVTNVKPIINHIFVRRSRQPSWGGQAPLWTLPQ